MTQNPVCPACQSEYTYQDGALWICSMCAHEWNENAGASKPGESPEKDAVRDAHGNVLSDGDSIVLIKDLKLGGSVIKQGTLIKNITLADEAGHNIACRSKEFGSIYLKSEFVKKA